MMGSIMLDAIEKLKKQTPSLSKIHKSKKRTEQPHNTETDHFDMTGDVTTSVLIPSEDTFFSLLEKIGSGAFGVIRRSLDLRSKKLVAVKINNINKAILFQDQLNKGKLEVKDKDGENESTAKFVQSQLDIEENLTKALNRFYGSMYRVNSKGIKKKYLFSEYFEGKNLYERTKQGHTQQEKVKLSLEIAEELRKIHALNYLHLDLSLHNTIYDGQTRIIDFGLSAFLNSDKVASGEFRGTHIPPEMFKQHENGGKCSISAVVDIFAFGMIIYEIFTSTVFDPYKYEAYDDYKEYYVSFYQSALEEVSHSQDKEPWKIIVSGMIDENPEKRISLDRVIELLNEIVSNDKKIKHVL